VSLWGINDVEERNRFCKAHTVDIKIIVPATASSEKVLWKWADVLYYTPQKNINGIQGFR